jgi:CheY-like chemotaxis protein
LFKRTIKVVAPLWDIREAANGETAIHLASDEGIHFDLIFVDMYMTAVTQQMLGTEAVRELRHRGVTARICGLSAVRVDRKSIFALTLGFSSLLTLFLCRIAEQQGTGICSSWS